VKIHPWDAEDDGVVAEFGNEHRELFVVLMNGEVGEGYVGDVPGGDGSSIDYFEGTGGFEGLERELVMAREVFVYKGDACGTRVYQCVGTDRLITNGERARYNQMLSFH
jgi:hypothetical protein